MQNPEIIDPPFPASPAHGVHRATILGRYRQGTSPTVDVWRVEVNDTKHYEVHCAGVFVALFDSLAAAALCAGYLVADATIEDFESHAWEEVAQAARLDSPDPFYGRSFEDFLRDRKDPPPARPLPSLFELAEAADLADEGAE